MLRSMLTISETQSSAEGNEVEGGTREFEALFQEHWALVYGATLRVLGDPYEAEDLSLEIFWRLYRILQRDTRGDPKITQVRQRLDP